MKLRIADELSLPLDAVTQVLAFLGRRGNGKSYAAQKLCETMLDARAQVVALDPVGNWFGLRLSADGKGKGYSIPVFGGLHGDIPIEPHTGSLIADLIVDREISAIVDVSQFILSEQTRFAYDFATRLFQRKKASPSAIHVFIEECQEFVPQNIPKGENFAAKMLHAFERMVKLGRNFGIGASLISQRPQEINKKVLNQAECLFVFQMTGKHERDAILDWVRTKGMDEDVVDNLPRLEVGRPYIWSPQWLKVFDTFRIAEKKTFDASATPEVGAKPIQPKELSPIELEEIRKAMAATIEKAKQDDPKELRKRISELEKQLRGKETVIDQSAIDRAVAQVEKEYKSIVVQNEKSLSELSVRLKKIEELAHLNGNAPKLARLTERKPLALATAQPIHIALPRAPQRVPNSEKSEVGNSGLRRILVALAQRPQGLSVGQIGVRANLSSKSGTFDTYLSRARSSGWVEGSKDSLRITDAGLDALGHYEPLPTGQELLNHWLNQLGTSGASRILRVLADAYPETLTKDEVAARAELSAGSGTFDTYLSRLRSLELIKGRGELKASDELFD